MKEVSDIIKTDLNILFVGFNPGTRSALTGHHFAGYSNRFWKLLHAAGLTPYQLRPEEDKKLLQFGYGITNIVSRPSRTAAEITQEEYRKGRISLLEKLARFRPRIACYTGIGVYQELTEKKKVSSGPQSESILPGITDFVVPSPSGLNRTPFSQQLSYYRSLHALSLALNSTQEQ